MKRQEPVKAWIETIVIPTYEVYEAEKYPIFLEKRVYQGSSGTVYPHPVIEKISDVKVEKEWEVVFLENTYLKIMVLPALGGRIQMAYDKIKQRHFVYYNEVIKPALVGLTGPWISGGIEFNWPQHHRPSTYDPVDFSIEKNEDGSITVWVSEVERMFRTKGMAGITLYPDKAYLQIKGKLFNRTPHPQTFLWWANPAVAVNDHYQSVFPEDVNAVFDHGKRDVSKFPVATGTYYKVDYSAGVDISKYKNIPVPTSYMAIKSAYDFVGGYENDTEAGLLHVADHNISPGKKQWTWGNGDFGHAWDRNLTDSNGPYIELMCGVYTDNQPDFSWMQPYEEKNFEQYFMPYQKLGVVKNATKDALVNVIQAENKITVLVYVTGSFDEASVTLKKNGEILFSKTGDLSPESVFEYAIPFGDNPELLEVTVLGKDGKNLVSWKQKPNQLEPLPDPAKPAKIPQEILTNEELFLTGLHIEQYRHATYQPMDYYREGLKRDPLDIRCNNAVGSYYLRSGLIRKSIPYFERSITSLTKYNPNPYDGEPYFNLGLAFKFLGESEKAYEYFYKACWNGAWQDAGYLNLAYINTADDDFQKALEHVNKSLIRNWHNHKARHLKVALFRKLKLASAAKSLIEDSLAIDRFNFGILFEKFLLSNNESDKSDFKVLIRDYVHNYLEYALDYAYAGLYEEAIKLLKVYLEGKSSGYPIVYYCLGYFLGKTGDREQALYWYKIASKMPTDYCFPNRIEEVDILREAFAKNPSDYNSQYYLGNFWMAKKQFSLAKDCLENSLRLNPDSPKVLRNLSLIYYNKLHQKDKALRSLENAFSKDQKNSRVFMELDQLYKKLNKPFGFRKSFLEGNMDLVYERDDVFLEYLTLLNIEGRYQKALDLMLNRIFHPWEGGEGRVPGQYLMARIELAKSDINNNKFESAIEHLQQAREYPKNLGEGKLYGARENDVFYWLGCAYEKLGQLTIAVKYWQKASIGLSDPSPALYYNDQSPDKIFYQGLALLKLGNESAAFSLFNKLIDYGESHYFDEIKIDYFAVSLPDLLIWDEDLKIRNKVHCNYLIGLGKLGMGDKAGAKTSFESAGAMDKYHLGVIVHRNLLDKEMNLIE
ncbi:MAG: DUF5107 domain-containing protein [Mongoliibacter sp.]|uniref:tetratricopeptide repeat protein n=1 Tax=Mongoliibacter sp. TaxID=2022438 RepID=UPI0012F12833|nr:DUF5107 domain-containing protein [Mongoliibacter sp.]TVP53347.1 MAG: DUF5107 domain-containing protein [Mongoliibacter sp.]